MLFASPYRSARKPPVVAPVHMPRSGRGESNLLPKFQALQKQVPRGSPLRNEAGRAIASQSTKIAGGIKEEDEDEYEPRRDDKRNVLLPSTNGRANGAEVKPVQRHDEQVKDTGKVASSRRTPYDKVVSYLDSAIAYREKGEKVKVPGQSPSPTILHRLDTDASRASTDHEPIKPTDFIACWLDYAHKYGMGYALTDGSVGVQFNDDTTMVLAPNKKSVHQTPFPLA